MKVKQTKNITTRLSIWAVIVGSILLIPLLAKFPWTTGDFIFAGGVLFGCATMYELITRNLKNRNHRIVTGFAVLVVVLVIWAWAVA